MLSKCEQKHEYEWCGCVCFPYTSAFFSIPILNDMQQMRLAGWLGLVCAFTSFPILLPCLASLIISVGKFYVWTSAIMTIDGRISSGTNINNYRLCQRQCITYCSRIIINVNHKHEELRTKTLTHRCTNQQLMLISCDSVRCCCYSHPPICYTHWNREAQVETLKVWYENFTRKSSLTSIPIPTRDLLIYSQSTIKWFLGIYRWMEAWRALTP